MRLSEVEANLQNALLNVPNTPNPDVQVGEDDTTNVEIRKWGTPREFDFENKAHWDVGTDLGILDFERAAELRNKLYALKGFEKK